jgi:hypothetical protein
MLKIIVSTAMVSTVLMVSLAPEAQAQTRQSPPPTRTPSTLQVTPTAPPRIQDRVTSPNPDGTAKIETSCTGVQSCNDFIALCAASGGDFEGTAHDPEGRPSAGTCTS